LILVESFLAQRTNIAGTFFFLSPFYSVYMYFTFSRTRSSLLAICLITGFPPTGSYSVYIYHPLFFVALSLLSLYYTSVESHIYFTI